MLASRGSPPSPPSPATAAPRLSTLRFLAIGGWGRCAGASAGAPLLAAVAGKRRPAFVVSTGDNLFRAATFGAAFSSPSLAGVPWYAVMGELDWLAGLVTPAATASPASQLFHGGVSFSAAVSTDHYADPSDAVAQPGAPLLSVFYVDTTPWLAAARLNDTYRALWSASPDSLLSNLTAAPMNSMSALDQWQAWEDAQAARLAAALAGSGARWKVVVGHHSIYSFAPAGGARELARLNGILRRGGAHLYLSGDDASLQVIAASGAPAYVVSGTGGGCTGGPFASSSSLAWSSGQPGLFAVDVSSASLSITSYLSRSSTTPASNYTLSWAPVPQCTSGAAGMLGVTSLPADPRCGPAPASPAPVAPPPPPPGPVPLDLYASLSELLLPGGSDWDFVTLDSASGTVLIGRRADGVSIVDVRNASAPVYRGTVPNTYGTNGVTLLPDKGVALSNNGALGAMNATVFVLPSPFNNWTATVLGVTAFLPSLNSPGNSVYHQQLGKVAFTHHHRAAGLPSVLGIYSLDTGLSASPPSCSTSSSCLTLDRSTDTTSVMWAGVHTGKLHSPKPADETSVWLAVEDPGAVVRVDLTTGAIVQTFNLRSVGCARVTPIDVDYDSGVLFVGCAGYKLGGAAGLYAPLLLAISSADGSLLYSSPVGRHVDDLVYVKPSGLRSGRVFITCSGDAAILVFEQLAGGGLRPLEAIATQMGTKTMDFDAQRRIVFTAAPKGSCSLAGVPLDPALYATMGAGGELFYPTGAMQSTCPSSAAKGAWSSGTFKLFAYQAQH